MAQQPRAGTLRRELGPFGVGFLAFSALSPAASVYLFGAGVIHIGGTGTVLAVLLGGTMAALLGRLFGELGAAYPDAGGIYPAFVAVLGERIALPYMLMMLSVAVANTAYTLRGMAEYIDVLAPALPVMPVALGALVLTCGLAVLSIRRGAQLTGAFLAVEMVCLAVLCGVAFLHPWRSVGAAVMHPVVAAGGALLPLTGAGFALATATAIFTCGGATWPLYFGEEMHAPEKKMGRLVNWVALLAALTIGLPLMLAVAGAPDRAAVLRSPTPLAEYLAQAGSPLVARLVAAGVVLAVFNAVIASIMGYSRLLYATARDGMWPAAIGRPLARISPRFGSPLVASVVLALVSAAAMLLSDRFLLVLNSNENVFEYVLLGLAILFGRRRGLTGQHHRVGPYPALAVLAVLTGIGLGVADWFDPDAGRPSLYVLAGIILVAFAWHPVMRRRELAVAEA